MLRELIEGRFKRLLHNRLDFHTRELVSGATVAFVLKFLSVGLAFGFNLALARFLGASDTGIFLLAFTAASFAAVIGRLGVDNSILRFVASSAASGDWNEVKGAVRKGLTLVLAASAAVSLLMFLFASQISALVFSKPELTEPMRWISLCIVPFCLFTIYSEMIKGLKRVRDALLVQGVLIWGLSLAGLFLFSRWGVIGAVASYTGASALTAAAGYFLWKRATPELRHAHPSFSTSAMLTSCLPLFIAMLLTTVINSSGSIFLGIWQSNSEVGIFNSAFRTSQLLTFLLVAVNAIAAPKFAELYRMRELKSLSQLARNSTRLLLLTATPVLFIFLVFPSWVMGVFGSEFRDGAAILSILAVGQFINVATGPVGYILIMSGNERLMLDNVIWTAVLNIGMGIALIPVYGMTGAAYAAALSIAFQNIMASYLVFRKTGIKTLPWPAGLAGAL